MHTQQLQDNAPALPHTVERSEEAAIVGEIASHFIELKEATSATRAAALIHKLHALSVIHPEALWLVMRLLTGDLAEITKSYAEMGEEHARSKQGEQQSAERALYAIDKHFPHLAQAVIEIRHITAQFR